MSLMNLLVESGISFKDLLECSDNFCFNGPSMRSEAQRGLVNEWPADQLNCQWRWRADSVMPQNLQCQQPRVDEVVMGVEGTIPGNSNESLLITAQRPARAWKHGAHILQTSNLQNLGDVLIFLPPYAAKHGQVWNEVPEAVNPGYEGLHPHRLEEYHQSNMSGKSVQGGKPRPPPGLVCACEQGLLLRGPRYGQADQGECACETGSRIPQGKELWNPALVQPHLAHVAEASAWRGRLRCCKAQWGLQKRMPRSFNSTFEDTSGERGWIWWSHSPGWFNNIFVRIGLAVCRQAGSRWIGQDLPGWRCLCAESHSRWLDGGHETSKARVQRRRRQRGSISRAAHAGVISAPKGGDSVLLGSSKPTRIGHGVIGPDRASAHRMQADIHQRLCPHMPWDCSGFAFPAAAVRRPWRRLLELWPMKPNGPVSWFWSCSGVARRRFLRPKSGNGLLLVARNAGITPQYDCKPDIWSLGVFLRGLSCSSGSAWAFSIGILKEDRDARPSADVVVWLAYRLYNASEHA